MASAEGVQVGEDTVADKRRERRSQLRNGLQTGIERLVSGQFIFGKFAAPETFSVQAHVPVRQVFADEFLDGASRRRRIIIFERVRYLFDQRVQQRDDPAVDLGTFFDRHFRFAAGESVHVGVQREKAVRIVQRSEEFAPYFVHAFHVELEVVPRLRVRDHVPTYRVRPVFFEHFERIDGVAEALAHLVAVLVEHQTVRNDVFERHAVEQHRGQREEPAARLVHSFGYVIGRIYFSELRIADLERIVHLGVGHGPRIEPHVDQVALAHHLFTFVGYQHDVVHIGPVQIEFFVILFAEIAFDVTCERVFGHKTGGDRFVDFGFQLGG